MQVAVFLNQLTMPKWLLVDGGCYSVNIVMM